MPAASQAPRFWSGHVGHRSGEAAAGRVLPENPFCRPEIRDQIVLVAVHAVPRTYEAEDLCMRCA